MRIRLLGSGASEGVPAIFCGCEVCREARRRGGKEIRTRSAALINHDLKIDLPPETMMQMQRDSIDSEAWRYLLFTHSHDDHFAVNELQYLLPPFPTEGKADLTVYGSPQIIAETRAASRHPEQMKLVELELWKTAQVGPYQVTPVEANHKEGELCFNFIIEQEGRKLLYATDTGWYSKDTWQFLAGQELDAVIVEATDAFGEVHYSGHMNNVQVVEFRNKLVATQGAKKNARFVATHFSHTGRPFQSDLETALVPLGVEPGFDGLEFEI